MGSPSGNPLHSTVASKDHLSVVNVATGPNRKEMTMTIQPDDKHEHDEMPSITGAAEFLRLPVAPAGAPTGGR